MTGAEAPFLARLRTRVRSRPRSIVFPEGEEPRVHTAVAEGAAQGLFHPLLIGAPDVVRDGLRSWPSGVEPPPLLDPSDPDLVERTAGVVRGLREARGASGAVADELALDPLVQAAALVHLGEADGAVGGAVRTTADVVRAALSGIGLAPGRRTLSSAFFMVFEPVPESGIEVLTFTDAGVVPEPDADQLAEIAASAARGHAAVAGEEPRVAFLSYSTRGSAEGASVDLARDALARFGVLEPDVLADGELQGDAALVPAVAARKAPGSEVAGRANVLVFPDLASANLAYKLVQYLGGAHALGPILQGLARPFNDLSRGATPSDIVAVSCITSLMAP